METKARFQDREEEFTSVAWDVGEAIRAIKYEGMDKVAQRMNNTFSRGDDEPHKWVIIWAHFSSLAYFMFFIIFMLME